MEKEFFMQIARKLEGTLYTEEEQLIAMKALDKALKGTEGFKRKLIVYIFLNFHNVLQRDYLVEKVREVSEERLHTLSKIIYNMGFAVSKGQEVSTFDLGKKVIEVSEGMNKEDLNDFLNILNITDFICFANEDKLKLALIMCEQFQMHLFYDIDRELDGHNNINCVEMIMNYNEDEVRKSTAYPRLPRGINAANLNRSELSSYQLELKWARHLEDDDDSRCNRD